MSIEPDDTHPFDPPLPTSPADVYAEMIAAVQEIVPGFRILPGQGFGHLLQAVSTVDSEAREAFVALMVDRLTALLGDLHGVPQLTGAPATSTVTFTARDTIGHTLTAGRRVFLGPIALELLTDLVIPSGQSTLSVAVQAVEPASAVNGAAGDLELDEPQDWIADTGGVVLDSPLANGEDPETDIAYAHRLAEELTIQSARPILPRDFAVLARRSPAAGYAWPINLYDPDTGTIDAPGHVTVVVADPAAEPLSDLAMQSIAESLDGASGPIVGVEVHVVPPTYTQIDVTCEVELEDDFPTDAVLPAVEQAIRDSLTAVGWIERLVTRDTVEPPTDIVHDHQIIAIAALEKGARNIPTLTLNGGAAVTLTARTGLPRPGTITVTEAT